jgi:ubiquinone biosynthesis protein UbiJ
MEMKLFTDLIDALGKAGSTIKQLLNIPGDERTKLRTTFEDTYRLLDTTLNMIIFRLSEVLDEDDGAAFRFSVERLEFMNDWETAEREFRLCRSLRVNLRESESLAGRFSGAVGPRDWEAVLEQMRAILQTEGQLAMVISEAFRTLAGQARTADGDDAVAALRKDVTELRASLAASRRKLIDQELKVLESV